MYFLLNLTPEDRARIVSSLSERPTEADGAERLELAKRIDRGAGEESLLDVANSALRSWYYRRIDAMAEDVLSELLSGRIEDEEALETYLHESADGTDLVVYTFKAKCVLLASDNEDAMEEELGESGGTAEARAYFAIRADVRERLEAYESGYGPDGVTIPEGFDLGDPSTWTVTPDEDESEGTADTDDAPSMEGGAA